MDALVGVGGGGAAAAAFRADAVGEVNGAAFSGKLVGGAWGEVAVLADSDVKMNG